MLEIHTSLDEIIGFLTKLKDADPVDSHHASLDVAKKQDIVKQHVVTVSNLTNFRQSEAVVKKRVAMETESNEALSERGMWLCTTAVILENKVTDGGTLIDSSSLFARVSFCGGLCCLVAFLSAFRLSVLRLECCLGVARSKCSGARWIHHPFAS